MMANRNSKARQRKPDPFQQFIYVLLQTIEKKIVPRARDNPEEGFTGVYGFGGWAPGVLQFTVEWIPRAEAEERGLYEQGEDDGGGQEDQRGSGHTGRESDGAAAAGEEAEEGVGAEELGEAAQ